MQAASFGQGDWETGHVADSTVGHVVVLAGAFGVPSSYLVDRGEESTLDGELMEVLRDKTVCAIARESAGLPERERGMVLGIVRQLAGARDPAPGH